MAVPHSLQEGIALNEGRNAIDQLIVPDRSIPSLRSRSVWTSSVSRSRSPMRELHPRSGGAVFLGAVGQPRVVVEIVIAAVDRFRAAGVTLGWFLESAFHADLGHAFAGAQVVRLASNSATLAKGFEEERAERVVPVIDQGAEPEQHVALAEVGADLPDSGHGVGEAVELGRGQSTRQSRTEAGVNSRTWPQELFEGVGVRLVCGHSPRKTAS